MGAFAGRHRLGFTARPKTSLVRFETTKSRDPPLSISPCASRSPAQGGGAHDDSEDAVDSWSSCVWCLLPPPRRRQQDTLGREPRSSFSPFFSSSAAVWQGRWPRREIDPQQLSAVTWMTRHTNTHSPRDNAATARIVSKEFSKNATNRSGSLMIRKDRLRPAQGL